MCPEKWKLREYSKQKSMRMKTKMKEHIKQALKAACTMTKQLLDAIQQDDNDSTH
jgi:hypothetical protein